MTIYKLKKFTRQKKKQTILKNNNYLNFKTIEYQQANKDKHLILQTELMNNLLKVIKI